jgi:hypothetical protein
MSFFELPPPPEREPLEERPQPEWSGPPENVLGVGVPIRIVLARTYDTAVLLDHVTAYPTGLRFDVTVSVRKFPDEEFQDLFHDIRMWRHGRARRAAEGLPPELLRFGVLLADGGKATSLGEFWPVGAQGAEAPTGPILMEQGGGGGGRQYTFGYWLWPLPPPGPLTFVVEWPARGIEETRVEVDAEPIREAASRTETLWSPETESGSWTEYGSVRVSFLREEEAETEEP